MGTSFSCGEVAVIIEPKGFKQDQYRTTLRKNGATIKSFKPIWKEFFKEQMPAALRENEANRAQKFSDRMAEDDTFAKNINKWLSGVNFIHELGTEHAEKLLLSGKIVPIKGHCQGTFNGGEGGVEPGKDLNPSLERARYMPVLRIRMKNINRCKGEPIVRPKLF